MTYSYFAIKTGLEVKWYQNKFSFLYHASHDGKFALCGSSNLEPIHGYTPDPSSDTMACDNCQGLVRRLNNKNVGE